MRKRRSTYEGSPLLISNIPSSSKTRQSIGTLSFRASLVSLPSFGNNGYTPRYVEASSGGMGREPEQEPEAGGKQLDTSGRVSEGSVERLSKSVKPEASN